MSFLRFSEQPLLGKVRPRKTKRWAVSTPEGVPLGQVKWYCAWRRYCFMPEGETVFEQDCLREIAKFVEDQTRAHRSTTVPPPSPD